MKVLIALAICLLFAIPAHADDGYAAFYGDGIRAYTESRYDDALTHLYRAFAVRQEPLALRLIVRSHDFQGNCSARNAAATMLRELFPGTSPPPAQLCVRTGSLELQCATSDGAVRIDGRFDIPCGSPILLPVGPHEVVHTALGTTLPILIVENERMVAKFGRTPNSWSIGGKPTKYASVPRRWTRPNLLVDPDMPRTFEWKRPANYEDRAE